MDLTDSIGKIDLQGPMSGQILQKVLLWESGGIRTKSTALRAPANQPTSPPMACAAVL